MSIIRRHALLSIFAVEEAPVVHTFNIISEDAYVGKYFYCVSKYDDDIVFGTWSITSGSQYASINTNGKVTINSGVQNQSITIQCDYTVDNEPLTATKTITISYDNQLTIECSDTLVGTSGNAIARYNSNIVTPTWSIASGGSHATIDSTGVITILSTGQITIQAVYSGYTTSRTINVEYVANQSSSTEIGDDGSVTTTTTTTVENQDGSTTETSTSVTTNEDGSISQTESETTTNQDGSSTTTSTTQNQDGTSSESETNVASDGSSTSTTTNYNADGDPTSGSNNTTDVQGNSNTQEVEYDENGDPTVTGYTIDTTGNTSGDGEEVNGGAGINTEFVPFQFANDGFIMHIRFESSAAMQPRPPITADTEDNSSNYLYTILGAKATRKVGNKWPGFEIRWAVAKSGNGQSGTIQLNSTLAGESSTDRRTLTGSNNIYDVTITYDPLKKLPGTVYIYNSWDNIANKALKQANKKIDDNLDLEMTIGYSIDGNGNPIRHSGLIVYEFTVTKI